MDIQLLKRLVTQQSSFLFSLNQIENSIMNYGCVDGGIIGTGRSDYTQGATAYDLHIEDKCFALIDIPGIEGDESKYEAVISGALDKAHTIFYVNGSGKKIEKDTLAKVKKYMHDGTSVYAVFNVHCKAKKERIPDIDPTYAEELTDAYKKQQEIIKQTEKELVSFLGRNYKGSISLNGLLAFSALALTEDGCTTIVNEADKSLRNDQTKYLHEYDHRTGHMLADSHVPQLQTIIAQKLRTFDSDIYDENIGKLRNRIHEMIRTIEELNNVEGDKINGFIRTYHEFKAKCESAKDDFVYAVNHLASNVVESTFGDVRDELYGMIERSDGKLDNSEVEYYFDSHKKEIIDQIQSDVNARLSQALKEYEEEIQDARNRLIKDLEREQLKFQVSLSSNHLTLDGVLGSSLKYNLKDFGGHLFTTGSLALSGAGVGSMICPGIGTAIGAAVGAVLGILGSIWNFFASKQKRIDKAKRRIREAIDEIIYDVTDELDKEVQRLNCTETIESNYEELLAQADAQISSLETVKKLLRTVIWNLQKNEKSLT